MCACHSHRPSVFSFFNMVTSENNKTPGGKPQQLIGWRRGIGCECEKTDMILCVYWGLRVHIISFTSNKIGTFEQLCHIIKSKIVKGYKSHFPFRNGLCLSRWLNPSPSAVNPTFPVHKKANSSSHFTPSGPSIDNIRKWGLISEIKH